jgi:ferredoxin
MNLTTIKLIYFSPTETTKHTLEGITQGLKIDQVEHLNLTLPSSTTHNFKVRDNELAIIGVPVYAGRIPLIAIDRLQQLKGTRSPAVIVVVYGNREYEDALLELRDFAIEVGFVPIAAGAFIGEHSFSTTEKPIAAGRPDTEDMAKAKAFGIHINEKLEQLRQLDKIPLLHVPGNFPYKQRMDSFSISPITSEMLCTKCKKCATLCPTSAITINGSVLTNPEACILCCACIKNCPNGARIMEHPIINKKTEWLHTNFSERKEPEMYV